MRRLLAIILIIVCLGFIGAAIRPLVSAYLFLGFDHPKEYIVLLQNNMELRATGGFMGSFLRLRFDHGQYSLLKVEDIYTPDGQLDGHVDPPWPIQAAFGQGWYKLRDSNWDPDFPTAAKTIEWFFVHGGEPKADGLIAVNLSLMKEVLKIIGPIYILDQPEKITADNFYKLTQSAVETGFFPGSSQKRDFLSNLGKAVFENVKTLSIDAKFKLLRSGISLLKSKDILIYSHDDLVQKWLGDSGFDGALTDIRNTNDDYLAIFESNLGANKANCCILRNVKLNKQIQGKSLRHELKITYQNTNPASLKQPPQLWGGAYVNYIRIGVPIEAEVSPVVVGNEELPDRVEIESKQDKGIKFIGFFVLVDALNSKNIQINYTTGLKSGLVVDQQSGGQTISY